MLEFNNPAHGFAIAEGAGVAFNPAVDQVIANVRNGRLAGGVIYNGYTGASINLHTYGSDPKWASRDMLWITFHYPFEQLGCRKMFGQVPANNAHALDFDLKLGFKIEARIKDVFPDEDLIVVSMVREDCRWLKIKPSRAFLMQEAP